MVDDIIARSNHRVLQATLILFSVVDGGLQGSRGCGCVGLATSMVSSPSVVGIEKDHNVLGELWGDSNASCSKTTFGL